MTKPRLNRRVGGSWEDPDDCWRGERLRSRPTGKQTRSDGDAAVGILRESHCDTARDRRGGQAMTRGVRWLLIVICLLATVGCVPYPHRYQHLPAVEGQLTEAG